MARITFAFFFFLALAVGADRTVSADETRSSNDGAMIIDEEYVFEVHNQKKASFSVRRKIEIYKTDHQSLAMVPLTKSKFIKIKKFEGVLYNARRDTVAVLNQKDGLKVCGFSDFAFFADDCQWFYDLSSKNTPYTIEYSYELELKSLFFWPGWTPQSSVPVNHSRYTIIAPENFAFSTRINGDIPAPEQILEKGKIRTVYELSDVPAMEDEDFVYSRDQATMTARFVAAEYELDKYKFSGGSWESLGRDGWLMMRDCFVLNDRQKTLIEQIENSSGSQKEICDRLHEELIGSIRYVAIEIGIGGWRPTTSKETFERGYGDCKDLSILYVSMLNHVGIEAKPALVMTKDVSLTDPAFPEMVFNHVIYFVVLEGDTLWADPTCQFCDVGDLPWQDEDIFVLAVDSTGGSLIKTAASTAEDNCFIRKVEIDIDNDSTKTVQTAYTLSGTGIIRYLLEAFSLYEKPDMRESFLRDGEFGLSKKLIYDSIIVSSEPVPVINAFGSMNKAIQTLGRHRFLTTEYFSLFRNREKTRLNDRVLPVDMKYPISVIDSIIVNLPPDWRWEKLPDTVAYEDNFGSVHIDCVIADERLIISRIRKNHRHFIAPEEFAAFKDHLEIIEKSMDSYIGFFIQ
ncbi:MAG: DUF3857 and transglutaminase domain-containing protein [FCB group bacterium]|nr:DUF3857 and transglutaminase domain-containing protein [FCB group bacterium]